MGVWSTVVNFRLCRKLTKKESLDSQVIDFPIHGFLILPRKGNFATELDRDQAAEQKPFFG
jgi:hypothetical protein